MPGILRYGRAPRARVNCNLAEAQAVEVVAESRAPCARELKHQLRKDFPLLQGRAPRARVN